MNSESIRIDAQLLTGFQIKDTTCFVWVKDAVTYIIRKYPLAAQKKAVTLNVKDGDEYQIEEELIRLESVKPHKRMLPYEEPKYECDETGHFVFHFDNEIDITYRYMPPLPQSVSIDITMPDRFCEPIKYYVAARQRGRVYGQADAESVQFDNLFHQYLEEANNSMSQTNKRHRRMPAYRRY